MAYTATTVVIDPGTGKVVTGGVRVEAVRLDTGAVHSTAVTAASTGVATFTDLADGVQYIAVAKWHSAKVALPFSWASGGYGGFADGSAAAPSIYFTADPNTGIFRVTDNTIGLVTDGIARLTLDTSTINMGSVTVFPIGAVSAPGITFAGDTNTGIYSPSGGQVAISSDGTQVGLFNAYGLGIGSAAVTAAPLKIQKSLSGAPLYASLTNASNTSASDAVSYIEVGGTSAGDPMMQIVVPGGSTWHVGIDNSDSDRLKIGIGGAVGTGTVLQADASNITALLATIFPAGSASLPSLTASADTNTGMWFPAADTIAFSTGGSERVCINSSGNVGINTTSPDELLHVYGTSAGQGAHLGNAYVGVWDSSSSYAVFVHNTVKATSTSYCLLQNSSGATWLNAASGQEIQLLIGGTAAARINSSSNFGVGGDPGTGSKVFSNSAESAQAGFWAENTHATASLNLYRGNMHRAATTAYNFLAFWSGNHGDTEFYVRGDGNFYYDGAGASPADYAEYFETVSGQQIPPGTTVKLVGGKVAPALPGDNVIGVIRPEGASALVGNAAWGRWQGKRKKSVWGAPLRTEDGDVIVSPDWKPNQPYVPRSKRPEWVIVGLVGQVPVQKNQPTDARWVKMSDINLQAEMWFIR